MSASDLFCFFKFFDAITFVQAAIRWSRSAVALLHTALSSEKAGAGGNEMTISNAIGEMRSALEDHRAAVHDSQSWKGLLPFRMQH